MRGFRLSSGRDDRPAKTVAASHAEAVDRSNVFYRIGNENAHGLFAHRTAANEPFRRRWMGAKSAHKSKSSAQFASHSLTLITNCMVRKKMAAFVSELRVREHAAQGSV